MTSPSNSEVQNLLPVQAYFNLDGSFNTFIGQGKPFYATANPQQSGLNITLSTINSTTIGATTPSTGVFTNIATTTGTITTAPTGATDIANKQYVDFYAAGLSWKQPVATATSANLTSLSGLQTINGVTLTAGERVLVKDQTTASQNGIYTASASAWTYAVGADDWNEYVGAIVFVVEGSLTGTAWFCTAQPGGTLGVTDMNWSNFSVASSYTAGTGLTLIGTQFNITNTAVTAAAYGSATQVGTFTVNAQGQLTLAGNTTITPAVGSITGLGTGVATALAVNVGSAGAFVVNGGALGTPSSGTLTNCTFPTLNQNTTGYAAGLAGGLAGSVPYQSAVNTTTFLAVGSNGQVLTLASGVPSWATPTTGTVTSVSGTGTVSGISLSGTVTSTGSLTLGGTLDLSAPPAIGGTTANTVRGTTVTATSNFVGTNFDASGSGGGSLRTNTGSNCLQWGGGGGVNVTVDGSINMNGAAAAIQISPTSAGSVTISPNGTLTVNPATASTMNNVAIGGTTALAGTFTDLRFNNTLSLAGSTGTAGYVVTSNGASAPTWQALPASGITITDDTTTNASRYLTFTSASSGSITGANVSSTKLAFNPSAGSLGIGTSSPSFQLDIVKASASTPQVRVQNTTTTAQTNSLTAANDAGTSVGMGVFGSAAGTAGMVGAGAPIIGTSAAELNLYANNGSGVIKFATGGLTEQMRITAAGGVSFGSSGTAYGTSGQILTSAGNAPPTWATLTAGTGVSVSGTTINAVGTTINSQTSGYTLVAADAGKTISITTGGVTIPNAVMAAGNIVSIYNNSGSSQTITQGSSLTLQWAGQSSSTTGNRTLGLYGLCTIVFISSSNAVITGSGLT